MRGLLRRRRCGRRRVALHALRGQRLPVDHVIGRGCVTDVLHRMWLMGREEQHGSRADLDLLAVHMCLQRAFLDDDQLFVGVGMRGVRAGVRLS